MDMKPYGISLFILFKIALALAHQDCSAFWVERNSDMYIKVNEIEVQLHNVQ